MKPQASGGNTDAVGRGVGDVHVALRGIRQAHQDAGCTQRDLLIVDVMLQVGSEREDLEAPFKPSRGATECVAEFLHRGVELLAEVVDLAGFLDGRKIGTLGVFVQADDRGLAVGAMDLHGGDVGPAQAAARGQAAVAGNELPKVADATHADGVQETVCRDVVSKFLQAGRVQLESAVVGIHR